METIVSFYTLSNDVLSSTEIGTEEKKSFAAPIGELGVKAVLFCFCF